MSEQKLRISLVEKKGETMLKDIDEKNKSLARNIQELRDELVKKEKYMSFGFTIVNEKTMTMTNAKLCVSL